jgi:hypothetical protein
MGASGSGKSTLANSIVNFIMSDPESCDYPTQLVTAYIIRYVDGMFVPYSLTIIDTPGYVGDVELDIQATQLIANFLTHEKTRQRYPTIDAICLVANSNMKMFNSAQSNIIEAV